MGTSAGAGCRGGRDVARRPISAGHRQNRFRPSLPSRGTLLLLLAVGPFLVLLAYSLRPEASFLLARNLSVSVPYALGSGLASHLARRKTSYRFTNRRSGAGINRHLEDAHSGLPATGRPGRRRVHRRGGPPWCADRRRVHFHRPPGSGHPPLSRATPPCLLRRLEWCLAARCAYWPACCSRFRGSLPLSACSSPHRSTPGATALPTSTGLRESPRS